MSEHLPALRPEPLTAADFAPFGDVIEIRDGLDERVINYGQTVSYFDLADISLGDDGRPLVRLFRTRPVDLPFRIRVMERHPLASQMFMPLSDRAWLIVVAPPGPFDAAALRAFLASPDQGVNFRPGCWHHYSLAFEHPADFLVIDREGPGNNVEEVELSEHEQVWLDLGQLE